MAKQKPSSEYHLKPISWAGAGFHRTRQRMAELATELGYRLEYETDTKEYILVHKATGKEGPWLSDLDMVYGELRRLSGGKVQNVMAAGV